MIDSPILNTVLFTLIIYVFSFALLRIYGQKGLQWLAIMVGAIGILYQLLVNNHEDFGVLGFGFSSARIYLWVILTITGILFVVFLAGYLGKLYKNTYDWKKNSANRMLLRILMAPLQGVLIAVLTEELVFRGLIQRQLTQVLSPALALIIASAIFGIWHMPVGRIIMKFDWRKTILYGLGTGLVGAVFGFYYNQSGSLFPAGFAHAFWNGIVYAFWGLGGLIPGALESKNDEATHPEYGFFGVGALVIAISVLFIIF